MADNDAILDLLREIRDNQKQALARQEEHLAIAKEQIERTRLQMDTSIKLQQQAVQRFQKVSRIAIPGIVICVLMILYLLLRYF
ncbi:hypothetical protein [Neptuniibacter sp. CAU 1671]|uniref:hypothetical protein n=1 Tax=Neptuniibacter sp. CAU 1671 TaxID=3032593 RepID=UPI0023DBB2FE|nr:hypothetical protein [Neptuniibacter sp. CAU 1671]MDF2180663.1 hypothetical protein [Neptuniibacter sp. CAU 1671]